MRSHRKRRYLAKTIGNMFFVALYPYYCLLTHEVNAENGRHLESYTGCYSEYYPKHGEAARDESLCIRDSLEKAERKGQILYLKLTNGRKVPFKNEEKSCLLHHIQNCVVYKLVEYIETARIFVIEKTLYEGRSYVIVDDDNGRQQYINGRPHLSPDKSTFVISMASDISEPNGVEIWSKNKGHFKLTWSHYVPDQDYEQYQFEEWLDNDRVVLRVELRVNNDLLSKRVHLVRSGSVWKFVDQ